jgi:SAM-dependent methyltransferase
MKIDPDKDGLNAVIGSTEYNMVTEPNEPFYMEQYWRLLSKQLSLIPEDAHILDLGCGQGRLSIQLAVKLPGSTVSGCDLSSRAVAEASNIAMDKGMRNLCFRTQSIANFLGATASDSADLILFTEVTFFYPAWKSDLPAIVRALKPGGLLAISLRSQYFDALCLVKHQMWDNISMLLEARSGRIFDSSVEYTWQTASEVQAIIKDAGLELLDIRGIGVCSGIPGDPHGEICHPANLSAVEQETLMSLEIELGRQVIDGGRYIFALARKKLN